MIKMLIYANQGIQIIFYINISVQTTRSTFEVKYLINYEFFSNLMINYGNLC